MEDIEKGILIISHPDDECLFASSILEKISKIIICFNNIPAEKIISQARQKSLDNYPIKNLNIISLNLAQSIKTFMPINWLNIKENSYGLIGGYQIKSYAENYEILLKNLRDLIPINCSIITHNPWGEYGHSEHCQVFKASFQIALEKESKLFVDGYYSNLSRLFAIKKLHLLMPDFYRFETNMKIYNTLKKHYLNYGCWTWYKNYKLPKVEYFYRINLSKDPNSQTSNKKFLNFPLSYIKHKGPIYYYLWTFLKNIIPPYIKILFRRIYFNDLNSKNGN